MADYDPVAILRVLVEHGVEFVVIGGVAARLRGAPILTQDLDVTPKESRANLEKLARALSDLGAMLRSANDPEGVAMPFNPELLAAARSWTLTCRWGDLDLVFEPAGTRGFDDLDEGADLLRVASAPPLEVSVASLEDIVRSKQAAGRAKDLAALPLLRQTLDEIDRMVAERRR